MRLYTLQLKRAVSIVLFVLLLSAVGMTKALGFGFTVDNLNYSVNSDGVSVTVTGHVDGQSATGELVIPETVTYNELTYSVTTIGYTAFWLCTGFTGDLVIPNSVTSIESYAFRDCSGFTGNLTIGSSVETIGVLAFEGCTGFTGNLVIPNSVTEIWNGAFSDCTGFSNVEYNATDCADMSGWTSPFSGCGGQLIIGDNVERIPDNMFSYAAFTGNLIIPNSVTSIGDNAFCSCGGFTGNLIIPNSVTFIGDDAFCYCSGFTGNLTIGSSVTLIGDGTFWLCTGFTGDLVIPNSVTTIGDNAFYFCSGFSSVEYDATNCADASSSSPPFENCGGTLTIGENVERIPANMFRSAAFSQILSQAEIPPTVGSNAFYGINHNIPVYVPCGSLSEYQNARGWNEFNNIFDCIYTEITATVTPANSGTVTGAGTYEMGTTCTLTAIANDGYTFIYWTENGEVVSTEAEYSFTVMGDRDLVANFVEGSQCSLTIEMYDSYGDGWNGNKLTVSDDLGGYNEITLDSGSSGSTTLFVPDGSHITLGWIMGIYTSECSFNIRYANGNLIYHGENMSSDFSFEFDMDCVEMPATMFIISAIADPAEGGTVNGAGTYEMGTICTLTATDNEGYTFVNWTKNGDVVSVESTYTFTVTGDMDLVANFEEEIVYYTVTLTANPIEGGTVTGAGTYDYGTSVTIAATANVGYSFNNWTEDSEMVSTDESYTFTITDDHDFIANFTLNTYDVTVAANPIEGGTVTGEGTYDYGNSVTIAATANVGYTFNSWTEDGQVVSTDESYTFTITNDHDFVANFTINTYNVTVVANPVEGGIVTGAGTYDHGSTCTLTAIANTGYTFINWTKHGRVVSTNPTYSFTVTRNASYVANFELNSYTLTVTANPIEGGTIIGAGTYNHGTSVTIAATANVGYTFNSWAEDDTVVSTDESYTFTITNDHDFVANFTINTYNVTVVANPVEGGIVTGTGTYDHGSTCILTAIANTGYAFIKWTKDGTVVSTNPTYSFTVTEDVDLVANFKLPGDANGDGIVDALDIVVIVNHIFGATPEEFIFDNADVNGDGVVDALDIVIIVNIIFSKNS